jgi:hypothetical protein
MYFSMSRLEDAQLELKRSELAEKLREVDGRLRREMLVRGFDPDQQDNLALTGQLAKIYMERENVQAELDLLSGRPDE